MSAEDLGAEKKELDDLLSMKEQYEQLGVDFNFTKRAKDIQKKYQNLAREAARGAPAQRAGSAPRKPRESWHWGEASKGLFSKDLPGAKSFDDCKTWLNKIEDGEWNPDRARPGNADWRRFQLQKGKFQYWARIFKKRDGHGYLVQQGRPKDDSEEEDDEDDDEPEEGAGGSSSGTKKPEPVPAAAVPAAESGRGGGRKRSQSAAAREAAESAEAAEKGKGKKQKKEQKK